MTDIEKALRYMLGQMSDADGRGAIHAVRFAANASGDVAIVAACDEIIKSLPPPAGAIRWAGKRR